MATAYVVDESRARDKMNRFLTIKEADSAQPVHAVGNGVKKKLIKMH